MNIKEALDELLAGKCACVSRKDETGSMVYLYNLDMQTHIHLDVCDLVATNWKTLKRIPR